MLALAGLAVCSDYPRDISGTYDRIRASKVVRVGMTSQLRNSADRPAALAFIGRVARRAGGKPAIFVGATEPLSPVSSRATSIW